MPEEATTLNTESAAKLIEGLLSAPADKEPPVDSSKTGDAKPKEDEAKPEVKTEEAKAETEETEPEVPEKSDEEETPEPRKYKVKADGVEEEVTEEELLKGYSRQKDYTTKTQALAEERKALEAAKEKELGEVRVKRQDYETRLTTVAEALKALMPEEPKWDELRKVHPPADVDAAELQFKKQQERITKITAERDRVRAENDKELGAKADAHLAAERAKLQDAVPDWKEPEKFKTGVLELRQYAKDKLGFNDDELNGVVDHRLMLVLRKAHEFDKQAEAKPKIENKIKDAMETTKPGDRVESKPRSALTQAKAQVAKTGRREDAQKAIELLL